MFALALGLPPYCVELILLGAVKLAMGLAVGDRGWRRGVLGANEGEREECGWSRLYDGIEWEYCSRVVI